MSQTLGEEIDEWKAKYEKGNNVDKFLMQEIAAGEHFKYDQIWEFLRNQELVTNKEMLEALEQERAEWIERKKKLDEI